MKLLVKKEFLVFIFVSTILSVFMLSIEVLAWGDNAGGRPSYTAEEINDGAIGATPRSDGENYKNSPNYPGKIVFNSISDSMPVGDGVNGGSEKNFVGARECVLRDDGRCESVDKTGKGWLHNDITVEDGKTYIIRMYVHNNNPNGYDAVAENTRVSFSIPSTVGKNILISGFINSSNATPTECWDSVNFKSDVPFHFEYVFGSALLENNSIGLGGLALSDDIVKAKSGGTLIGYDALDGRIPGCYQYDNFVTIRVKAVFDDDFTVETKVRVADNKDKTWYSSVDAKIGDKVEFRIGYKNTSDKQQDGVTIKDILPFNLKYVDGTTVLKNSTHPNGATAAHDYLVKEGTKIGSYGPGANAYVYFTAEVVDEQLSYGSNMLVNNALVGVGDTTLQEYARVIVKKGIDPLNIAIFLSILLIILLLITVILTYKIQRLKKEIS